MYLSEGIVIRTKFDMNITVRNFIYYDASIHKFTLSDEMFKIEFQSSKIGQFFI